MLDPDARACRPEWRLRDPYAAPFSWIGWHKSERNQSDVARGIQGSTGADFGVHAHYSPASVEEGGGRRVCPSGQRI